MADRYIKLIYFQLEVMNILEIRAHEIYDEDRILVMKNWLDHKGLLLMEIFMKEEKRKIKQHRNCSQS